MSILQMSISAGFFVIAIVIIRAVALNRLPKTMFLILWGVVLLRLLVPVSISSQFSVYTVIGEALGQVAPDTAAPVFENILPIGNPAAKETDATTETDPADLEDAVNTTTTMNEAEVAEQAEPPLQEQVFSIAPTTIIWLIGMLAVFIFFTVAYFKNHRELRFALLIRDNGFLNEWLAEHRIMRPIAIMQSDRITTPVAVGMVKPRIILPKSMNMDDKQLLRHVLTHEYYHIRRFDTLWKLILAFALCIHWFNPLVWVMFLLANRDLELTCDEMVLRHFGADTKTAYAYSLIGMAEHRRKFTPLYNGFSKNAAEERIVSIMKYKKTSLTAIVLAVLLVIGTTTTFALSASASQQSNVNPPDIQNNNANDRVLSNNEAAPLRINSSDVKYDDNKYHWPSNAISVTNTSDKTIASYEIACLAYDKSGNPLELYWDALNVAANGEVGSVGFGPGGVDYGIVTGISPVSPKSYSHVYRYAYLREQPPEDLVTSLREQFGDEWVQNWLVEWKEAEKELAKEQAMASLQTNEMSYSLFDGWEQLPGEHIAKYIISCVKQVTFDDGSVWVNPEYQNWLDNHQGKSVAVNTLENYYN